MDTDPDNPGTNISLMHDLVASIKLSRMQKKVKHILLHWLNYYRSTLGKPCNPLLYNPLLRNPFATFPCFTIPRSTIPCSTVPCSVIHCSITCVPHDQLHCFLISRKNIQTPAPSEAPRLQVCNCEALSSSCFAPTPVLGCCRETQHDF